MVIKDCTIVYSGGGCYLAYGELECGIYFYGDVVDGYMVMGKDRLEKIIADDYDVETFTTNIYTCENQTQEITDDVIRFKKQNDPNADDNFDMAELERIVYRNRTKGEN